MLVVGAVVVDVRRAMRRARNPVERNELRSHGIVYGLLMASFVGMLFWAKHGEWSQTHLLVASGLYSLAIIALGVRRARIHRRHRGDD